MAQLALGIAGAVVGSFFGAPEIGFMIGSALGGLLFPAKGPQAADLKIQDSAYGKPIPKVYGCFRLTGNMIWAGQPIQHDSGKGGTPTGPTVSMSFAMGLCKGPIGGIRRIWANGKLIYDMSDPSNFQQISGSSQMVTAFTVYPGDENQTADPTMQAALGVANVPAYRGLAYVVFNNLDLSQWSNFLPSFSFEVITNQTLTSYTAQSYSFVFPPTTYGAISMMPCLAANGGQAMGYGYYLGYSGIFVATLGPYGTFQSNTLPTPGPGSLANIPSGYSDTPGILHSLGWVHPIGVIDSLSAAGPMDLGTAGSGQNFWRNGGDIFMSSTYSTSGRPIYRLDLTQNGLIVAQSTQLDAWAILGGTESYVYAFGANSGKIYQFNRLTLAVTATYTSPSGSFSAGGVGYVVDDNHIYMQGSNLHVSLYQPASNTLTDLGLGVASTTMTVINPNFIMFANCTTANGGTVQLGYMTITEQAEPVTLSSIVADICANQAGLSTSQYDVSQLTPTVWGYGLTNHSSPRDNLSALMQMYFFDVSDGDGLLKFVMRGNGSAVTIPYSDVGASTSETDTQATNPLIPTIQLETELPRSITLTYEGTNNDYQANTQRAFRAVTKSNLDSAVTVPIVLADDEALTRVQSLLWSTWVARTAFQFSTSLAYGKYEPTDVVTLTALNGQTFTTRITKCQYDGKGVLQWGAVLEDMTVYPNSSYSAQGGEALGFLRQTIDYSGPTILVVLDVPPLRDQDTSQQLYLAACGMASNWPGCVVDVSRDGTSYTDLENIPNASVIGYATTVLGDFHGGNQPDELNTVTVQLYGGGLSSVTYANFLAGVNAAYLGGELILFRNATQVSANTYTLSGFLRARGGTEWAKSTHALLETFVFLDPTKLMIATLAVRDIGTEMYFEPHLLNIFSSQPVQPVTETPAVACVKPLSPVHFTALPGSAASLSDITVQWTRRARVNAEWLDGTDVPLDEASETYQLVISNSSNVTVRTVVVTGTGDGGAYTYTAANITADGFSTGNTINFSVAQNSNQGVLGYAATTSCVR